MSRLGQSPGAMVGIDGRQTHIQCSGTGSPTVILEAGIGSSSLQWSLAQGEIATFTRVCSYDRAGTGWSAPGRGPRDALRISDELMALLAAADEPPPYILVGHSLGGTLARVFASRHPQDVAGLVLVDPGPVEMKLSWIDQVSASVLVEAMPLLRSIGVQPLRDQMEPFAGDLSATAKSQLMSTYANPTQVRTFRDEFRSTPNSSRQAAEAVLDPSLPVVVLSAGTPMSAQQEDMVRELQREHAGFAARFALGRHRIIDGANHLTLVTNHTFVDEIVSEIRQMIGR